MQRSSAPLIVMAVLCGLAKAQTVDHPLQIGGQVKPPVAIYTPDPEFPKEALTGGTAPHFAVGLVVDQKGLPQNVKMIRGMNETLDKYALEAIRQYRFKPATLNGQPVAVLLNIEVNIDPF